MAKKNTPATTTVPADANVSKAEAIRKYHEANPNDGPKAIAEALTKQGIAVTPGRVSAVLRSGSGSPKVDVEAIKTASQFVQNYGGKIGEAIVAIETVGKFVEQCGSADKAKAALEAYQAVAALVNGK